MKTKEIVRTLRVSKNSVIDVTELSPKQKKCWCVISQALQEYIEKDIKWSEVPTNELGNYIPLNNFKEFEINFSIREITDRQQKKETIRQIKELKKVEFVCDWIENNKPVVEFFNIINSVKIEEDNVKITLPLRSIRRILDFGVKGFTAFDKRSFIGLSSKYSMDFYLFLSENYKNKVFDISIEEFKERMKCPESYDSEDLKKTVFTPALKEYEKNQTRLSAKINLFHKEDNSGKRGRKKLNYIKISIIDREL